MTLLLVGLPGNEAITARLAEQLSAQIAVTEFRHFPDGESYVRIVTNPAGRSVALICTMARPDDKFLRLVFTARVLKDLGAVRVGLIVPYLSYMRQDRRFQPGEAVTSGDFAELISREFDWLITIDPHLHRIAALSVLYPIPTATLHASTPIAKWIAANVDRPLLIGPDSESAQWVGEIASLSGAPYVILEKLRRGDREVEVSVPAIEHWLGHTPVVIDDIISTARTIIATLGHLARSKVKPAVCVGVHAIFATGAYAGLQAAGAARIVTTNTVPHETNAIDIVPLLAEPVAFMERASSIGLGVNS